MLLEKMCLDPHASVTYQNLQPCVTCAALCHHSHYKIMPHSSLQLLLKDFFIKYSNQLMVLQVYVL